MKTGCFVIWPLIASWRKQNAVFCTSQWDCPRYQYCHYIVAGVGTCRDFPLIPLPVPVPTIPRGFPDQERGSNGGYRMKKNDSVVERLRVA